MAIGDKYTQLLLDQPSFNDGTMGGGIANVIQQGLRGYMYGQEQEELDAQQAVYDNVLDLLLRNNPATAATQVPMESASPRFEAMAPIATGGPRFADDASPAATALTQLAPSTTFAQVPGMPSDLDQAIMMFNDAGMSDAAFNLLSQKRASEADEAKAAEEAAAAAASYDRTRADQLNDTAAQQAYDTEAARQLGELKIELANIKAAEGGGSGDGPGTAYDGTGMVQQDLSRLLVVNPDGTTTNADPSTQRYAVAYANLSKPTITQNEQTGETTAYYRDMSTFLAPTFEFGQVPDPSGGLQPPPPSPSNAPLQGATVAMIDQVAGEPARTVTEQTGEARFTPSEAQSAGFADRLFVSSEIIEGRLEQALSLSESLKSEVPWFGNYLVSDATQSLLQAERDFVNAKLREESGAAIAPEEFASAELQYFPRPGDGPDVIAKKKANRELVYAGMVRQAGRAYISLDPSVAPPMPAGVPATARYSPKNGNWWWASDPNNPDGEWEHN